MAIFTDAQNGQGPNPIFRSPTPPPPFGSEEEGVQARRVRQDDEGIGRLDEIRMRVRLAVGSMLPARPDQERRREHRYPFPHPVLMTPVDANGKETGETPFTVIGRHLSEQGLDFYSKDAVPHRYLVASIPVGEAQAIEIVLDLNWCRFGQHGWYENGGKFTQVVG